MTSRVELKIPVNDDYVMTAFRTPDIFPHWQFTINQMGDTGLYSEVYIGRYVEHYNSSSAGSEHYNHITKYILSFKEIAHLLKYQRSLSEQLYDQAVLETRKCVHDFLDVERVLEY